MFIVIKMNRSEKARVREGNTNLYTPLTMMLKKAKYCLLL